MTDEESRLSGVPTPGLLDQVLRRRESLATSYSDYRREVYAGDQSLDHLQVAFIVAAMDLVLHNPSGAVIHLTKACDAGASPAQVFDLLELVLFVAGPTVLAAVRDADLAAFDQLLVPAARDET